MLKIDINKKLHGANGDMNLDVNLNINEGDFIALAGQSGSGKTTLLRILAGLESASGHISIADEVWLENKNVISPQKRKIGFVFQDYALFPNMSIEENLLYVNKDKNLANELLEITELSELKKRLPNTLSGGQKQRVALAQALAQAPEILLLDEPFSHIDNFLKQGLRRRVFNYLKDKNIACIVATHDKEDVLGFADQIFVLQNQSIVAKGAPQELYKNPEIPLVAAFFGEFNIIKGEFVYAHQLKIVDSSDLKATVKASYFKGNYWLVEAKIDSSLILFEHHSKLNSDEIVNLEISK